MRTFFGIAGSAIGGLLALLIVLSVFGLVVSFFSNSEVYLGGLLIAAMLGIVTGSLAPTIKGDTNPDLLAALTNSLGVSFGFFMLMLAIMKLRGIELIRTEEDWSALVFVMFTLVASFGILPGLGYYVGMLCFMKKK